MTDRVWAPQRLRWGTATALWVRAKGLRLEEVPGRLVELLVTTAGDIVARVQCAPVMDGRRTAEELLLPWGTWTPTTEDSAVRLRALVVSFGLEQVPEMR